MCEIPGRDGDTGISRFDVVLRLVGVAAEFPL